MQSFHRRVICCMLSRYSYIRRPDFASANGLGAGQVTASLAGNCNLPGGNSVYLPTVRQPATVTASSPRNLLRYPQSLAFLTAGRKPRSASAHGDDEENLPCPADIQTASAPTAEIEIALAIWRQVGSNSSKEKSFRPLAIR